LVAEHGLAHRDLDGIVREPGQIAVARAPEAVRHDLLQFFDRHPDRVAEAAYGDLIEQAPPYYSELALMNPGLDACLLNNLTQLPGKP
jgi:hypothetical protein